MKPTCETCDYFDPLEIKGGSVGICRLNGPSEEEDECWPHVSKSDWCGEHQDFAKWQAEKELEDYEWNGGCKDWDEAMRRQNDTETDGEKIGPKEIREVLSKYEKEKAVILWEGKNIYEMDRKQLLDSLKKAAVEIHQLKKYPI